DDPKQRQPAIDKAKKLLDWTPKVSREDGLKITYAYFKSLSKEDLYAKEHNSFEEYIK
ncbi:MAG: SDR family NAD-dependent epimerase/dehydratase, partial [Cyclobacteriaceae bacterium]|nr:SDR family NAD-dependent epimerase/dehydratase [Cyclobacteriaceae bacterium]